MSDNQERLTVRLTKEAIDEVKAKAAAKGMTVNEFVRRALGTELYLLDQIDAGASVVLERPNKPPTELVLR
ncbi:ribbon-helix-helix protein, CopG family [Mesorhizobium sp. LNJC384A00]|uniref:plasmid mobilization protein n=1 Tax=Mesorhizobium sp. LNJC384A00 TaxID=1287268 RepID=UPI000A0462F6|nr:ribbon-helix-helix protein, CopG family [Mesorhizobium sp. LNJC384A00]